LGHIFGDFFPNSSEGSFLNGFSSLWEKLAPRCKIDALMRTGFTPRREVGA
jgi:hypothetical protein